MIVTTNVNYQHFTYISFLGSIWEHFSVMPLLFKALKLIVLDVILEEIPTQVLL